MRIFVDSADANAIKTALAYGYVYGVTTNPTLLRRAGVRADQVPQLVEHAFEHGAHEVQVQTYSLDEMSMVRQGKQLAAIHPGRVVIKIPATAAGYAAAPHLVAQDIRVTLTAVYTNRQALLAQSVGASYIAVYLGRMRDAGNDPFAVVQAMQALIGAQRAPLQILAASIRTPEEVDQLGALGVAAATIAPKILEQLLESPDTHAAATTFAADAAAIQ